MDFNGKVVLITGASSGIGATTAVYFSKLGAKLSLTGRNEENLKKTAATCKEENGKSEPFYLAGDMSKEEDVANILGKTIERFGRLDVLVNNAGIAKVHTLESLTLELYDEIMNTNIRGVVLLTNLAMPYLIENKGNVVNISSIGGLRPGIGPLIYSLSKSAMDQFTKCVALEVAAKQVRVNSVNPGGVWTDIINRMGFSPEEIAKIYDAKKELNSTRRMTESIEIATVIAFLASDLASNITGVLLTADGGYSLRSPQ